MDIQTVESIRNDIKKHANLFSILESREKRREKWTKDKKDEYEEFLTKLKFAHDNYMENLQNEIITKTKIIIKNDIDANVFTLIQPQFIDCELDIISPNTIFKGVWDKKKRKYDRLPHIEAGINGTPIEEINERMSKYGYKITDITKKGEKTTIKIDLKT
jgi:hypothetical protein